MVLRSDNDTFLYVSNNAPSGPNIVQVLNNLPSLDSGIDPPTMWMFSSFAVSDNIFVDSPGIVSA